MSSKARYYLEQTVPELEDLQKKGLFDKHEITLIMRRRTDFEHRLSSRGSKSRDYLKYVDYEMNLEKLRKKRYTRLSSVGLINTKPSVSDWASDRRVLFIYDRAVQKFPNDFQIWEAYLSFAKQQKLFKKIYKIYTQLLQLHPTSVSSWISAANFEYEYVGSAKNARTLFQRGLRFNKDSKRLWISYTIFELSYISKLLSRRQILGLITEKQQQEHEASENKAENGDDDENIIQLPSVSHEELKGHLNTLPDANMNMLGNQDTNPALRGDVALTVAEIAIDSLFAQKTNTTVSEFDFKYQLCLEFLDVFDKFEQLNRVYLGQHLINYLMRQFAVPKVLILDITLPLRIISVEDGEFIDVLQRCTKKYLAFKSKANNPNDKSDLKALYSIFLNDRFLDDEKTDGKVKQIMHSIIKKL